jgi:hypothetical protein
MMPRVFRPVLIAGALALACLAIPGVAAAAVTITSYKITSDLPPAPSPLGSSLPDVPAGGPSTGQAGANPDAGSYSSFSYPNTTEDLKTALTNFAPGLLGNPESVPKCSEAALQAGGDACPAASLIGASRLDAQVAVAPSTVLSFDGDLYNAEPLGNEPGRLAAITDTPSGTLVSSIPFHITPRGGGDYGLTGTLTDISRLTAPFPNDLQVRALSFIIDGSINKYVRNPTSCQTHNNTGQAAGYDDPTFVEGPAYQFGTTGCDTVPFRPVELNTNNTAYKLCSQAQADADNCPAESKFGGVAAKSPFLAEELKGPIYLIQQSTNSLPGLLLDLRGRVHVKIQTQTTLVNNRAIQSLLLNSPQLPISEVRVGLNGGRNTGVFLNRQDLCFRGDSSSRFNEVAGLVKFYGHNGATTTETKLKAKVNGCGPGVKGQISRATRATPLVRVEVDKHPDAPNFKELTISLSRNLRLVESRFKQGARATEDVDIDYVSRRTLRVTGLPAAGDDDLTVLLRRGAVRVSDRSLNLLRRGRSRTFSATAKQTPVSGAATSTRGQFRARGSR